MARCESHLKAEIVSYGAYDVIDWRRDGNIPVQRPEQEDGDGDASTMGAETLTWTDSRSGPGGGCCMQRIASENAQHRGRCPHSPPPARGGRGSVVLQKLERRGRDLRLPGRRSRASPKLSGRTEPASALGRVGQGPAAGRDGDRPARRRVHLYRAHPAGAHRGSRECRADPRPRPADEGDRRGARPAPRHLTEPRGRNSATLEKYGAT